MKKFKINKVIILSLLGIMGLQSCNDENFGENYNQNEYGIYSSDYKSLMAGAFGQFALRGGNNFYMKPILYSQYQSQVIYTSESQYNQEGGQWDWYYVRALNNFDKIIADYSSPNVTPMMEDQGSASNMIGVSKIMRAIIYKKLTDAYGDLPYSEANKIYEDIKTPKFDTQESIYKSLINNLKEGRDLLNAAEKAPVGDLVYRGDVLKWKKLANSVLLQASLQLSKKYPSASGYAATEFNSALNNSAGVIEVVADEAWHTFNVDAGVINPLNPFRRADYRLSAELVESLKGTNSIFNITSNHTNDARRSVYASNNNPGLPYGYNTSDLAAAGHNTSGKTQISTKFTGVESPMNFMTAGYTYLNRAEASALGWTTEDIPTMLTNGIKLNYQTLEDHYNTAISSSANSYIAARVADIATFGAKRIIGEEKWVALFNNGFDAWSEFRRTGYPNLKPAPSSINGGTIPRRLQYPVNEQIFNSSNYNEGVSRLSPSVDLNTSKVWWDQ